ncbi:MAG: glutamine--fructose-6-phosphate aminotransferase, partial [Holdemania filiformis]
MEKPTMAGYILDQGRALRQSFAERACFVDPMIKLFQNQDIRKVYFLGSGTSYHAALSFKNWFEKYLKVEAEVVIPTVFTNYTQINNNAIYQPRQILV